MKVKFFLFFQVLHSIGKQAYKLELAKKWSIYNVLHMLLLDQNNIRKRQVYKNDATKFNIGHNENGKYKVEAIQNSAVYTKELKPGYLLGLYYLVF